MYRILPAILTLILLCSHAAIAQETDSTTTTSGTEEKEERYPRYEPTGYLDFLVRRPWSGTSHIGIKASAALLSQSEDMDDLRMSQSMGIFRYSDAFLYFRPEISAGFIGMPIGNNLATKINNAPYFTLSTLGAVNFPFFSLRAGFSGGVLYDNSQSLKGLFGFSAGLGFNIDHFDLELRSEILGNNRRGFAFNGLHAGYFF